MKLISWNVNGIRAILKKGFAEFIEAERPDVVCLQEVRALPEEVELNVALDGYESHWFPAEKRGYSGVATFTKIPALSVARGLGQKQFDSEGRVIAVELRDFNLVNSYTPNAQRELARLPYRMKWDAAFRRYVKKLDKSKPVIWCGDINVAHEEIDLTHPKSNRGEHGFTDQERSGMTALLRAGFVDAFRELHPGEGGHYSWWSNRGGAREKNVGWRVDYFGVSRRLWPRVKSCKHLKHTLGSDHCPVVLEIE